MNDYDCIKEIKRAQAGDKVAEEWVIAKNLGLVRAIAKRFLHRETDHDDIYQIGCLGLLKAVKRFDESYNVKFSTYAVPLIVGEIKRFLRDDGVIKVSRSLKERSVRINRQRELLSFQLGRDPSVSEIAKSLDLSSEEIVEAMDATQSISSLQEKNNEDDTREKIDQIYDDRDEEGETIDRMLLKQALRTLEARDRQIIVLRYFKDLTQTEIAKTLGISQVQVSRLEKKILSRIKCQIASNI